MGLFVLLFFLFLFSYCYSRSRNAKRNRKSIYCQAVLAHGGTFLSCFSFVLLTLLQCSWLKKNTRGTHRAVLCSMCDARLQERAPLCAEGKEYMKQKKKRLTMVWWTGASYQKRLQNYSPLILLALLLFLWSRNKINFTFLYFCKS